MQAAPLQQLLAQPRHLLLQLQGIQGQQLQRWFIQGQAEAARAPTGLHRRHRQIGALQPRGHQGIEPCHQGRRGAAVFDQAAAIARGHLIGGLAVGGQLAAAEAIDRLFGVAHHHQQVLGPRAGEGPLQDAPLDRIGVLKLIDQGGPVAAGHRLQQWGGGCGIGAGVEPFEQLAKPHLAGRSPPLGQLAAGPVGEVQQQQLRRPLHQGGDGLQ